MIRKKNALEDKGKTLEGKDLLADVER